MKMKAKIQIGDKELEVDLSEAIDISIPMVGEEGHVSAWYVDPIKIEAVRADGFVGSVREGGSVNFRSIHFNPHGHGTHTECVGHITEEVHSVNQNIKEYFQLAQVLSIEPKNISGDQVITKDQLQNLISDDVSALVLRTLPNSEDKMLRNYSGSNPPYLSDDLLVMIREKGIRHLLLDLPSVDREVDGGALKGHRAFWNVEGDIRMNASITEMIYVPNHASDGHYLLNLNFPPFENDASPSRPLLFAIK
jgi:arylformamidase